MDIFNQKNIVKARILSCYSNTDAILKSDHLNHKYIRKEGDKYIYEENDKKDLRNITNDIKLHQNQNTNKMKSSIKNPELFLESLLESGFKRDFDEPGLKLKNNLGVSLDEVLYVYGFTRSEEQQANKTWINFRKEGYDFEINYRKPEERLAEGYETEGYATISFKK